MLQNLHTHTVFGDGKNTPEEMVLGALAAGCTSLGFSEHSPLPSSIDPDGWTMKAEDVSAYRGGVLRLREAYRDRLEIFLGLEQDLDSPPPEGRWDYLIGSVHTVWADGVPLSVDEGRDSFIRSVADCFGGDYFAFARAYYARVAGVAARTGCQIVGHFDLVTKFNEGGRLFDEGDPRYRAAALEALEALPAEDLVFEINTGAMSRGYRADPYPAPFLLHAIRARGGCICLTSDCHSADAATYGFAQAARQAMACGFRETMVLTRKGFQAAALETFL